jgi:hypothetical protein
LPGNATEILLNECTFLLDRVVDAWTLKNDLEVRAFDLWLVQARDQTLFKIQQEIVAEEANLPVLTAQERRRATVASSAKLDSALNQQADLASLVKDGTSHVESRLRSSAWFGEVAGPGDKSGGGVGRELETARLEIERPTFQAAVLSSEARLEELRCEVAVLAATEAFESKNRDAKLARHEVSAAVLECREFFAAQRGFGLNYRQRISEVIALLDADMRSLLFRMRAAEAGLPRYFGIAVPTLDLNADALLVTLSRWLRWAVDALLQSAASEREYAVSLSVHAILGDAWDAQCREGRLRFEVPPTVFGPWPRPRIKAIGAAFRGDADDEQRFLALDLSLPGPVALRLGNVRARRIGLPPAMAAGRGILNLSPVGMVEITFVDAAGIRCPAPRINDLELDYQIAVSDAV